MTNSVVLHRNHVKKSHNIFLHLQIRVSIDRKSRNHCLERCDNHRQIWIFCTTQMIPIKRQIAYCSVNFKSVSNDEMITQPHVIYFDDSANTKGHATKKLWFCCAFAEVNRKLDFFMKENCRKPCCCYSQGKQWSEQKRLATKRSVFRFYVF